MEVVDKNYTSCQECPDGIYKNEDQDGFVYCDRCGHKVKRNGEEVQNQNYSLDPLAGAVTVGDDFGFDG